MEHAPFSKQHLSLRGLITKPWQSFIILLAFIINTVGPLPIVEAQEFDLPVPGAMVSLSPSYDPPILKGIKVDPANPFKFDFILDQGDASLLKTEATKLIKYFLASLSIPDDDLWVNLSPYENNRIIPQRFGLTEMGRDLLAEDYLLKQITASLIYPESEIGKKFWQRVYAQALKKYKTTMMPVNTFNKVWIVPDKAIVYENTKAATAYVAESSLKVMLEEDYLALSKNVKPQMSLQSASTSQLIREIVIPALSKEVNEGKNFAQLRQVYNSLILAQWYKMKIKNSILHAIFEDRKKIAGVGYEGRHKDVELIYERYIKSFKKGVYNYIKEEPVSPLGEIVPRKYFSGGVGFAKNLTHAMTVKPFVKGQLPIDKPGLLSVEMGLVVPGAEAKKIIPGTVRDLERLNSQTEEAIRQELLQRQRNPKAAITPRPGQFGGSFIAAHPPQIASKNDQLDLRLLALQQAAQEQLALTQRQLEKAEASRVALGLKDLSVEEMTSHARSKTYEIVLEMLKILGKAKQSGELKDETIKVLMGIVVKPLGGYEYSKVKHRNEWLEELEPVLRNYLSAGQLTNEEIKAGHLPRAEVLRRLTSGVNALNTIGALGSLLELVLRELSDVKASNELGFKVPEQGIAIAYELPITLKVAIQEDEMENTSKVDEAIKMLDHSIGGYLSFMKDAYAKSTDEKLRQKLSGVDIAEAIKVLSISNIKGSTEGLSDKLKESWPDVMGAMEIFLRMHYDDLADHHRAFLLAMMYRGYKAGRQAGLELAGEWGVRIAADKLINAREMTTRSREELLSLIAFIGVGHLTRETADEVVSNIAKYNDEGTQNGRQILDQYKNRFESGNEDYFRDKARKMLDGLRDLSHRSNDVRAVRDEVLAMPLEFEEKGIEGYAPEDYGVGFEFEMKINGPLEDFIDQIKNVLKKEGLYRPESSDNTWDVENAGGGQMEITTPVFENSPEGYKRMLREFNLVFSDDWSRQINTMHINSRINPLIRKSKASTALLRTAKFLEAVLYRIGRNKLKLNQRDFHHVSLIDKEVLFQGSEGQNRSIINLRSGKIEGRYQLPPAQDHGRKLGMNLLQEYVHMQFALTRFASLHAEEIDMLHMPLPVLLGEKRGAEWDSKLFILLDKIFGDDLRGKAVFLKLYFNPLYGKWRYMEGVENVAASQEIKELYANRGYAAIYEMHRRAGGWEQDPVGLLESLLRADDIAKIEPLYWEVLTVFMNDGTQEERERLRKVLEERRLEGLLVLRSWNGHMRSLMEWFNEKPLGMRLRGNGPKLNTGDELIDFLASRRELWSTIYFNQLHIDVIERLVRHWPDTVDLSFLFNSKLQVAHIGELVHRLLSGQDAHRWLRPCFRAFGKLYSPSDQRLILDQVASFKEYDPGIVDQLKIIWRTDSHDWICLSAFDILLSLQKHHPEQKIFDLQEDIMPLANSILESQVRDRAIEILMVSDEYKKEGLLLAIEKHSQMSIRRKAIQEYIAAGFDRGALKLVADRLLIEDWHIDLKELDLHCGIEILVGLADLDALIRFISHYDSSRFLYYLGIIINAIRHGQGQYDHQAFIEKLTERLVEIFEAKKPDLREQINLILNMPPVNYDFPSFPEMWIFREFRLYKDIVFLIYENGVVVLKNGQVISKHMVNGLQFRDINEWGDVLLVRYDRMVFVIKDGHLKPFKVTMVSSTHYQGPYFSKDKIVLGYPEGLQVIKNGEFVEFPFDDVNTFKQIAGLVEDNIVLRYNKGIIVLKNGVFKKYEVPYDWSFSFDYMVRDLMVVNYTKGIQVIKNGEVTTHDYPKGLPVIITNTKALGNNILFRCSWGCLVVWNNGEFNHYQLPKYNGYSPMFSYEADSINVRNGNDFNILKPGGEIESYQVDQALFRSLGGLDYLIHGDLNWSIFTRYGEIKNGVLSPYMAPQKWGRFITFNSSKDALVAVYAHGIHVVKNGQLKSFDLPKDWNYVSYQDGISHDTLVVTYDRGRVVIWEDEINKEMKLKVYPMPKWISNGDTPLLFREKDAIVEAYNEGILIIRKNGEVSSRPIPKGWQINREMTKKFFVAHGRFFLVFDQGVQLISNGKLMNIKTPSEWTGATLSMGDDNVLFGIEKKLFIIKDAKVHELDLRGLETNFNQNKRGLTFFILANDVIVRCNSIDLLINTTTWESVMVNRTASSEIEMIRLPGAFIVRAGGRLVVGLNSAMGSVKNGGIDLRAVGMKLGQKTGSPAKTFGDDRGIEFHLDSAMLQRIKDATSLVPVIVNIKPIKSLAKFLEI